MRGFFLIPLAAFAIFFIMTHPRSFARCQNVTITLPDKTHITAETAVTEQEKRQGLAQQRSLAKRHGMLFLFSSPGIYPFWMKDTLIPLDIIWLNQGEVVEVATLNPPQDNVIPRYMPLKEANAVLEIGSGQAAALGITPGSQLTWPNCEKSDGN